MSATPDFPNRGRTPLAIGGREFSIVKFPEISVEVNARTVTLEPINEPSITQHMGVESKKIDIRGSCFRDGANYLDDISDNGDPVSVTSDRFNGDVVIESASTNPAGFEIQEERVYDYRLSMREATERSN